MPSNWSKIHAYGIPDIALKKLFPAYSETCTKQSFLWTDDQYGNILSLMV